MFLIVGCTKQEESAIMETVIKNTYPSFGTG